MSNDKQGKYRSQQVLINKGLIACQLWIKPATRLRLKIVAAHQMISMSALAQQILESALTQENPNAEREFQLNGPR